MFIVWLQSSQFRKQEMLNGRRGRGGRKERTGKTIYLFIRRGWEARKADTTETGLLMKNILVK